MKTSIKTYQKKKISNETHVSLSDPEASLTGKSGCLKRLYCKAHVTSDADSRVIVDTHVTTGRVDECRVFVDRLKKIEEQFEIKIEESIADRGYGSGEIISDLKN